MNRIAAHVSPAPAVSHDHPALRAEKRLSRDVESMLRDMAFVMRMTQRVKTQILKDRTMAV